MRSSQLFRTVVRFASAAGLLSCCALVSCQKTDEKPEPNELEGVYIAGTLGGSIAVVWENGRLKELTDGSENAAARAVSVDGNNVWVAGSEFNSGLRRWEAKVWKNGVPQMQEAGATEHALAVSLAASGGDVYAAGQIYQQLPGLLRTMAVVWKNGELTRLTDGSTEAEASAVAVSGSDVYVAGRVRSNDATGGKYVAVLWKNSVPQPLSDGTYDVMVTAVSVSNGVVYVTGVESRDEFTPMLWRDGVPTELNDSSHGNAIPFGLCVDGADVYVAGSCGWYEGEKGDHAVLWKNGGIGLLPGTRQPSACAVVVSNGHVYVAGQYELLEAGVWKDGKAIRLPAWEGYSSAAYGIFVK